MAQRTQDHPNLLIIMTDQQSSSTLGCYGGTAGATPHVDGLAHDSALLSNYFSNTACCTPWHAKRVVEDDAGPAVLMIDGEIGDEQSFMTVWLTSRAIKYVGRPHDRPFFLTLSIPDPHDPFSVRTPFDTMFDAQDMAIPDIFHQTDVPEWLKRESVTRWHHPPQVVGNEETLAGPKRSTWERSPASITTSGG